jgi:hypothetical protein
MTSLNRLEKKYKDGLGRNAGPTHLAFLKKPDKAALLEIVSAGTKI